MPTRADEVEGSLFFFDRFEETMDESLKSLIGGSAWSAACADSICGQSSKVSETSSTRERFLLDEAELEVDSTKEIGGVAEYDMANGDSPGETGT